jgi:hypothetical protein
MWLVHNLSNPSRLSASDPKFRLVALGVLDTCNCALTSNFTSQCLRWPGFPPLTPRHPALFHTDPAVFLHIPSHLSLSALLPCCNVTCSLTQYTIMQDLLSHWRELIPPLRTRAFLKTSQISIHIFPTKIPWTRLTVGFPFFFTQSSLSDPLFDGVCPLSSMLCSRI